MGKPKHLGRKFKNRRPEDSPAESLTVTTEMDVPISGHVEINQDEKLQWKAFVKIREEDIELANRRLNSKVPVPAPINNLQPKLPIEDEAASVTSSVQQESRKLPLKEGAVNVRRNLEQELLREEEAIGSVIKREDSIQSDSDEVDEEPSIGEVALAVVDFPNNIQKWGKIPREEVNKMKKIVMQCKQSGEVGEVLEQLQDLNLSESDNRLYCNAQYALKESYLKPSPSFVYKDGLKNAQDAVAQPSSVTIENLTAEEIECMQRLEFYKDMRKDYMTLCNMPKASQVPKSPPLPSVEVIKEHSRLLEQQIKEVVELLHAQGKISEKLGETIISLSEEKKMTEESENFVKGNEEAATFITENGIDELLRNYNK